HLAGSRFECVEDRVIPARLGGVRLELEVPPLLRLTHGRAVRTEPHSERMPRRKLARPRPDALRVRDEAEGEIVGDCRVVELVAEPGPRQKGLQLGREDEGAADGRVVERLLAGTVARAEEDLLLRVPDREGEHARQPVEAVGAEAAVGLDEHLGVRARAEANTFALELIAQAAEVVDLAVEDDPEATVARREGLVRVRAQVDDREAAVPEADAPVRRSPQALRVWPAVDEAVPHPLHERAVDALARDGPGDAAHQDEP